MEVSEKFVERIIQSTIKSVLVHYEVPQFLTVEQVAERLGVSKETVRTYIQQGELRAYNLSDRIIRLKPVDVNDFMENRATEANVATETNVATANTAADAAENPAEPEANVATETNVAAEANVAAEKPEEPAEPEIEQCPAVNPKTGARCLLPAGHEGPHCTNPDKLPKKED